MDPDVQAVQNVLNNDPAIQAALKQIEEMRRQGVPIVAPHGRGSGSLLGWAIENLQPLVQRALDEQGLRMPHDWSISLGEDGRRVGELNRKGWWDRNVDWMAPAIVGGVGVAGGLGAAGAFGGGGGAGAGAGATAGAGAGAGTGAGVGGAATTAGALTGTGADIGLTGALGALPATTTTTLPAAEGIGTLAGVGAGTEAGRRGLGALLRDPNTYATGLDALGQIGAGLGEERGAQNEAARYADQLRNSIYNTRQTAEMRAREAEEAGKMSRAGFEENQKLNRSQIGLSAPSTRARQSLIGSLLQNLQPVQFSNLGRIRPPTMTGGLTPAALNPEARQTGSILQRQAIDALLSGSDVPAMTAIPESTDFRGALVEPPPITPYVEPGTGESTLSGLGTAGSILSGILKNLSRTSQGRTTSPGVTE